MIIDLVYIGAKLAADLSSRSVTVKAVDSNRMTSSHSASPSLFSSPTDDYGVPDDWKMSPQVDYYGASYYFKHVIIHRHLSWNSI
jgi:hypothetical protein